MSRKITTVIWDCGWLKSFSWMIKEPGDPRQDGNFASNKINIKRATHMQWKKRRIDMVWYWLICIWRCTPMDRTQKKCKKKTKLNNVKQTTVELRLMDTPLIRSPCYYGHFFLARQNDHTFAYKKTPLVRSLVNTANGQFFKFPTHIILYNLTPLIRSLEKTKTPMTFQFQWSLSFTNQTAGFLNFHYRALISGMDAE